MIRRFALAAVLGAAIIAVPAAPAQAIASCRVNNECITSYYADAQHTQLVGSVTEFCDGVTESVGTLRGYAVVQNVPCN